MLAGWADASDAAKTPAAAVAFMKSLRFLLCASAFIYASQVLRSSCVSFIGPSATGHALQPQPQPQACSVSFFHAGCSSLGYSRQPSTNFVPCLSAFFFARTAVLISL